MSECLEGRRSCGDDRVSEAFAELSCCCCFSRASCYVTAGVENNAEDLIINSYSVKLGGCSMLMISSFQDVSKTDSICLLVNVADITAATTTAFRTVKDGSMKGDCLKMCYYCCLSFVSWGCRIIVDGLGGS